MAQAERRLHLDRDQPLRIGAEQEEVDSMAAGSREVPDGAPAVVGKDDLHDRLPDVARDPGEAAAALLWTKSRERAGAGAVEAIVELVVGSETAGDQIALERDRLCRAQRLRKRRLPSHPASRRT